MKKRIFAIFALVMLLWACTDQTQQMTTTSSTTPQSTTQPTTQPTAPPTTLPPSGWQTVDGKQVYLDAGIRCTGWQLIQGLRYYFDADGFMQTGWLELEEGTYYLDESGNPVTGSVDMDGETYLFNPDGTAFTGFLESGDDTYYYLSNGMMAKGEVEVEGKTWYFTSQGKNLLIVNFRNPVAQDYKPELVSWRNKSLEPVTMEAVKTMITEGEAMGHRFWLNSAYRSWSTQQNIWNKRYNQYIAQGMTPEQATEKVSMSVATPGHSEHHTGLAVDIDGTWESLNWMKENSWRYGLIVRYPEGKTEYTGVIYEPWHFRYVGQELAKELYESGLCVEEYMEMLTTQQGR